MNLKWQSKHKKLLSWKVLVKSTRVMYRALKDPHYWIEEQNRKIPQFAEYIYSFPFYKKRFDVAGIKPSDIKTREDFKKLPPMYKAEYREWILHETSGQENDKYKYWMRARTTGSTGTPMELFSLPTDRAAEIANLSRCAIIQRKGFNPFIGRLFNTMVGGPLEFSESKSLFPYSAKMSSICTPADLVEGYNKAKPDFYLGNKTAVLSIARHALDNSIPLFDCKCVASISEPLFDNDRAIIGEAFGPNKLFDIYGCAETGNFAVDRPSHPGKHIIWNDTHVVNLFNSKPVVGKNNVFTGELMLTSLIHHGFPVVNYIVGDTIELTIENEVPYITGIHGRTNDEIKNSDGSTCKWMSVSRLLYGITDIIQFRVIQKSLIDLELIIAAKSIEEKRKKEIENIIKDRSEEYFGTDLNIKGKKISFKWCDRIPPDANGKLRILVSEL